MKHNWGNRGSNLECYMKYENDILSSKIIEEWKIVIIFYQENHNILVFEENDNKILYY